jgi:membrane protease YdiL (CAAX protease family)
VKITKTITYLTLLVLLAVRFPIGNFASNLSRLFNTAVFSSWMDPLMSMQNITYYIWERYSFVIAGVAICINLDNLKKINIDRFFLVLFAANGIIFCRYYFWPAGWMGLLIFGYIAYMLLKNKFENDTRPGFYRIIIILFIAFFLYWLYTITFIGKPLIDAYINFVFLTLPGLLVEEVIFRGLFWMCLEELGWPSLAIVFAQALLFWVFHIYYMFSDPILFWLALPIGIILGTLVLKYKSITPGSIAHILFNLR